MVYFVIEYYQVIRQSYVRVHLHHTTVIYDSLFTLVYVILSDQGTISAFDSLTELTKGPKDSSKLIGYIRMNNLIILIQQLY